MIKHLQMNKISALDNPEKVNMPVKIRIKPFKHTYINTHNIFKQIICREFCNIN